MGEPLWKSLGAVVEEHFTDRAMESRPRRLATGFPRLDALLGGGLAPGLTVLGGSPGLGKSTFALQAAEHIAGAGQDVLYFSLEMSGERLAAKALSRRIFLSGGRVTADQLTGGGAPLSAGQRDLVARARAVPAGEEHLFLIEDPLSAPELAAAARDFGEERGSAPLVVVDYLQILPGGDLRSRNEKQMVEESLKHMTALARAGLPVLLISSLNRSGYYSAMQPDAFKETGGIEYSADVLLGLQFCACHGKAGWDINAEKNKSPRDVEVSVLKQRYGSSGGAVRFQYYAAYDYFREAEAVPEKNPAPAERLPAPLSPEPEERPAEVPSSPAADTPLEEPAPAPEAQESPAPRPRSETFYSGNTKICNELRQGRARPGREMTCKVFGPGSAVATRYTLSTALTGYDCALADALYTIYKSGRAGFTLSLLLSVLSGGGNQTLTPPRKEALLQSLTRLLEAEIRIDCTAEMRARGVIGPEEEKVLEGPFLAAEGDSGRGWRFRQGETPLPLFAYSELTGQIIRFPRHLLAVRAGGKPLSNTRERLLLKRFLIRRLEVIRNPHNRNKFLRTVSFARTGDLAEELEAADRRELLSLQRTAVQILDYYREIGYVSGWESGGDSLTITGPVADPWRLGENP